MRLDRRLAEIEPCSELGVREPAGEKRQDLELAFGQGGERWRLWPILNGQARCEALQQATRHRRGEHRLSGCDNANSLDELRSRDVLGQVIRDFDLNPVLAWLKVGQGKGFDHRHLRRGVRQLRGLLHCSLHFLIVLRDDHFNSGGRLLRGFVKLQVIHLEPQLEILIPIAPEFRSNARPHFLAGQNKRARSNLPRGQILDEICQNQ